MNKLKDEELEELFIKIVRPYEENIKTKKMKIISYGNKHKIYIDTLINLKPVGKKEFQNGILKPSSNNTFIFYQKSKEGTLISFIRHLRNCIAHCSVQSEKNSFYQFKDMEGNKCSMLGNIDINILYTLIQYIHTESERLNIAPNTKAKNKSKAIPQKVAVAITKK